MRNCDHHALEEVLKLSQGAALMSSSSRPLDKQQVSQTRALVHFTKNRARRGVKRAPRIASQCGFPVSDDAAPLGSPSDTKYCLLEGHPAKDTTSFGASSSINAEHKALIPRPTHDAPDSRTSSAVRILYGRDTSNQLTETKYQHVVPPEPDSLSWSPADSYVDASHVIDFRQSRLHFRWIGGRATLQEVWLDGAEIVHQGRETAQFMKSIGNVLWVSDSQIKGTLFRSRAVGSGVVVEQCEDLCSAYAFCDVSERPFLWIGSGSSPSEVRAIRKFLQHNRIKAVEIREGEVRPIHASALCGGGADAKSSFWRRHMWEQSRKRISQDFQYIVFCTNRAPEPRMLDHEKLVRDPDEAYVIDLPTEVYILLPRERSPLDAQALAEARVIATSRADEPLQIVIPYESQLPHELAAIFRRKDMRRSMLRVWSTSIERA
ncbi:hypothetical protein PYCC9005_001912 [Savitreella phatthalungensis]